MTTKELIRAEIEQRKNKAETMRERGAYLELLSFLDTPPNEPVADCHDLEEAKEEYIRKDAMMEWLEGMMTKEGVTEGFVGGYDFALKDVINKLNEL